MAQAYVSQCSLSYLLLFRMFFLGSDNRSNVVSRHFDSRGYSTQHVQKETIEGPKRAEAELRIGRSHNSDRQVV